MCRLRCTQIRLLDRRLYGAGEAVAYEIRKLNDRERRYSAHDKEMDPI